MDAINWRAVDSEKLKKLVLSANAEGADIDYEKVVSDYNDRKKKGEIPPEATISRFMARAIVDGLRGVAKKSDVGADDHSMSDKHLQKFFDMFNGHFYGKKDELEINEYIQKELRLI